MSAIVEKLAAATTVVGFVGLGRMGSAMATNLAAGGYQVVGHVRRAEKAALLAATGIRTVTTLEQLRQCGVVISMLPDDAALTEVVVGARWDGGLTKILPARTVHVSMSTISPDCAKDLAAEHARHGQAFASAPVLGNPDAARRRELFIVAAGAPGVLERCSLLFDCLGQRTFVIGTDPSMANLVKLAGNVMSAATMEIMGEVVALARKRGMDPEQLMTILTSTLFGSRVHQIYGSKIVAQAYEPAGFVLPLALKDVRLALAEGERSAVPMPTVSVVRDRILAGIAKGHAHLDWSALGLIAAEEAGLVREGAKP
jgi:3-hydroxyisobutyrate dehydrogenase-like beta-hydroxyacid dehydrogenase